MLHTHADAQRRRLRRVGKTRKSAPDVAARRLGQVEAYLAVRRVLSEASTSSDGVLSCEGSYFYRFGYGTLGYYSSTVRCCCSRDDLIHFSKQNPPNPPLQKGGFKWDS
jgi:hypothetical protein